MCAEAITALPCRADTTRLGRTRWADFGHVRQGHGACVSYPLQHVTHRKRRHAAAQNGFYMRGRQYPEKQVAKGDEERLMRVLADAMTCYVCTAEYAV